jgi:hypothetical protein
VDVGVAVVEGGIVAVAEDVAEICAGGCDIKT